MSQHDLIVIGASPAGLQTASVVAENGFNVKILEKRKNFTENPRPADTSFYGLFRHMGFEPSEKYIEHKLKGMKITSPKNTTIEINTPGFAIDREKFDQHYLDKAIDKGSEVEMDIQARDIKVDDRVHIKTEKQEFKSKCVVIASGTTDSLVRSLDLKTMRYPEDLASSVQVELKNLNIPESHFHYYLGKEVSPGWKATVSPKGDGRASIGSFVRNADPHKYLNRFLDREMFSEAEIIRKQEGEDQIITIPSQLVSDRIMVVGGAAGQAGIPFAMAAGKLSGEVAVRALEQNNLRKESLMEYQDRWRKKYLKYYRLARFSLKTIEKMTDEELDEVMKSIKHINLTRELENQRWPALTGLKIGLKAITKNPRLIGLTKKIF